MGSGLAPPGAKATHLKPRGPLVSSVPFRSNGARVTLRRDGHARWTLSLPHQPSLEAHHLPFWAQGLGTPSTSQTAPARPEEGGQGHVVHGAAAPTPCAPPRPCTEALLSGGCVQKRSFSDKVLAAPMTQPAPSTMGSQEAAGILLPLPQLRRRPAAARGPGPGAWRHVGLRQQK